MNTGPRVAAALNIVADCEVGQAGCGRLDRGGDRGGPGYHGDAAADATGGASAQGAGDAGLRMEPNSGGLLMQSSC